ncbi:MAG: MCE family protein [Actinomycetota bacterium]|nr:MCE family protein [Actinomycetota bacterium]
MKALTERDPFRVGLVALVLGALVGGLVIVLSVVSFGTTTYTAELEHTAGLRKGEDVQIHGVSVGKVTGIDLEDRHVEVSFVLDDEIDLGSRTTATVKVATLLGTHYLEVDPQGSGSLEAERIPLERTQVPYNLQDVIEGGAHQLEELDGVQLATALTAASDTLAVSGDDIGPALEGVGRLSEMVSRRSEQTGQLLQAARGVSDQLARSSDDIVSLMEQTNLVVSEVTARRKAIHRLLVETTSLSRALTAIVSETQGDLRPALVDLNEALDSLTAEDNALERVLRVMAPAVRYMANATGSGPFIDLYALDPAVVPDDAQCKLGSCP